MKYLIYFSVISIFGFKATQKNSIPVEIVFGNQEVKKDEWILWKDDSLKITLLKFYISNAELSTEKGSRIKADEKFHLIDLAQSRSLEFSNAVAIKANQLSFYLGIDSVSHEQEDYQGALDPLHGMYWTWQSGFVNFKLEGILIKGGGRQKITLHLGGYQGPYKSIQTVIINKPSSNLRFDLKPLIENQALKEVWNIMSVSQEALEASQQLPNCF